MDLEIGAAAEMPIGEDLGVRAFVARAIGGFEAGADAVYELGQRVVRPAVFVGLGWTSLRVCRYKPSGSCDLDYHRYGPFIDTGGRVRVGRYIYLDVVLRLKAQLAWLQTIEDEHPRSIDYRFHRPAFGLSAVLELGSGVGS